MSDPHATSPEALYGDVDPSDFPAYTLREVAHHLKVPPSTISYWALGAPRRRRPGGRYHPVITIADSEKRRLSFTNLVELHVLRALRRVHEISLPKVRDAVERMGTDLSSPHPLAHVELFAGGGEIFVRAAGEFLGVSEKNQMEMAGILRHLIDRVDRDPTGPTRLYPFSTDVIREEPRTVLIDPGIQFGRPCLLSTGVPTDALYDRWLSGESLESLAEDYAVRVTQVEEAIRFECRPAA